MNCKQFARDLVISGELDPPYLLFSDLAIVKSPQWIDVALMHYFLFYDLEGAVKAADETSPGTYWRYVLTNIDTFKRGKARRHFRGDKAKEAIIRLAASNVSDTLNRLHRPNYHAMVAHLEQNYKGCQIGPYFQWKLMDIFDRCLGLNVTLSMHETLTYLPETPRKAAEQFFPLDSLANVLGEVVSWINDLPAPGVPNRTCSYAEAETVLCAMYGMNKGTYKFGSDLIHRREELKGYPQYAKFLPPLQNWSQYDGCRLESPTIPA